LFLLNVYTLSILMANGHAVKYFAKPLKQISMSAAFGFLYPTYIKSMNNTS